MIFLALFCTRHKFCPKETISFSSVYAKHRLLSGIFRLSDQAKTYTRVCLRIWNQKTEIRFIHESGFHITKTAAKETLIFNRKVFTSLLAKRINIIFCTRTETNLQSMPPCFWRTLQKRFCRRRCRRRPWLVGLSLRRWRRLRGRCPWAASSPHRPWWSPIRRRPEPWTPLSAPSHCKPRTTVTTSYLCPEFYQGWGVGSKQWKGLAAAVVPMVVWHSGHTQTQKTTVMLEGCCLRASESKKAVLFCLKCLRFQIYTLASGQHMWLPWLTACDAPRSSGFGRQVTFIALLFHLTTPHIRGSYLTVEIEIWANVQEQVYRLALHYSRFFSLVYESDAFLTFWREYWKRSWLLRIPQSWDSPTCQYQPPWWWTAKHKKKTVSFPLWFAFHLSFHSPSLQLDWKFQQPPKSFEVSFHFDFCVVFLFSRVFIQFFPTILHDLNGSRRFSVSFLDTRYDARNNQGLQNFMTPRLVNQIFEFSLQCTHSMFATKPNYVDIPGLSRRKRSRKRKVNMLMCSNTSDNKKQTLSRIARTWNSPLFLASHAPIPKCVSSHCVFLLRKLFRQNVKEQRIHGSLCQLAASAHVNASPLKNVLFFGCWGTKSVSSSWCGMPFIEHVCTWPLLMHNLFLSFFQTWGKEIDKGFQGRALPVCHSILSSHTCICM